MVNSRYIGICIYCGTTDKPLKKEHVIPYGLNGEWTLLEASCGNCEKITSAFEGHALRDIFISTRSVYGLRSRHRKLPQTGEIIADVDGEEKTLEYPLEEFGSFLSLLDYPPPAYLDKRPYTHGSTVNGIMLISTKGNTLEELGKYLGIKKLSIRSTHKGNVFERFIAKIAYGFAVFNYGLERFENIYVLPAIMNKRDDIGMWFGRNDFEQSDVDIDISLREHNGDVIAEVRLFAKLPVPTYGVVVGKLKES